MNKTNKNLIFLGGFSYPHGMAGTKRVQHFIDYLSDLYQVSVIVVQSNSQNPGIQKGIHKNTPFAILGYSLRLNPFHLFSVLVMLVKGIQFLGNQKRAQNFLYVYNGVNVENFVLVGFAKLLGYKIVLDIVEDYTFHREKLNSALAFKINSHVFFEKHASWYCDGLVTLSMYLYGKFEKQLKEKAPVELVPISASVEGATAPTGVLIRKDRHQTILFGYSGSFGEKDGIQYLLAAFNNVTKKNDNVELLLSGKGQNIEAVLANNANPRIKYVGYLADSEFYPFLNSCDILCMTRVGSVYANAGFPFKLGEYLATGKPVIASKVSDVDNYLIHGRDALLVEAENVNDLENAMVKLLSSSELREKLGKNGQDQCRKHFDPKKNGEKLNVFLQSLGNKPQAIN